MLNKEFRELLIELIQVIIVYRLKDYIFQTGKKGNVGAGLQPAPTSRIFYLKEERSCVTLYGW